MCIFAPKFNEQVTAQKSLFSDAFLSKNADGDYWANDCFCAKCKSGFNSTFTGKEKDLETGYSYFGARYLDHELMTMWLSVDPMADKYPSISPYAYCAWNPLKLVDPEGKDWYDLYDDGTLIRNEEKSKEYKKYDVIYSVSKKKLSDMMSLGTMSEQTKGEKNGYKGSKMSLYGNREDNVIASLVSLKIFNI